jgi:hypothetical protein
MAIKMEGTTQIDLRTALINDFQYVPLSIRQVAVELGDNTLWRKIGRALLNIPSDEKIDNARLRNRIKNYVNKHDIGYMDVENNLEELERRHYIHVESHSPPVYYPTSKLVQGLEFMDMLEEETIKVVAKSIANEPTVKKYSNIIEIVRNDIYSALKDSLTQEKGF